MTNDNAVATLLAVVYLIKRRRAADILNRINERGIERRKFQEMLRE